jgi:hypothetical protein
MPNSSTNLVWGMLAASQFICLSLLYSGVIQRDAADANYVQIISAALGGVSLFSAGIVIFLFRRLVLQPLREREIDLTTPEGAQQIFLRLVACWAVSQSIAVNGFVLAILAGSSPSHMLPFLVLAFFLMWITRPWSAALRTSTSSTDLAQSGRPIT